MKGPHCLCQNTQKYVREIAQINNSMIKYLLSYRLGYKTQEDEMEKQNAILTVVGKDHTGILAAAATEAAKANANIEDVSQSVLNGFFSMVMVIDVTNMEGSLEELQKAVQDKLPDMAIHLMHENIFKAMHTI